MTLDTSGLTSEKPFAFYDRDSQSLKTWRDTDPKGSPTYSATVPKTGSMSNGHLYELPMSEPLTGVSDSSSLSRLLPTPRTSHRASRKAVEEHSSGPGLAQALEIAQGVLPWEFSSWDELPASWQLLPTPMAGDARQACNSTATRHVIPPTGVHAGDTLTDAIRLLPTPNGSDAEGSRKPREGIETKVQVGLPNAVKLLPTEWGLYEPAVRRWEQVTRPAPAPTEPNKNGRPRLTVAFDEWMMGVPEGWIADVKIPYGAKIRLCGNGVVPQQAEHAIRELVGRLMESQAA